MTKTTAVSDLEKSGEVAALKLMASHRQIRAISMNNSVFPHNPSWAIQFQDERRKIATVFGEAAVTIHHMGSTSIPGILAKPIIDILVEASDLTKIDDLSQGMVELGYEVVGEFGIRNRRYFRKSRPDGTRTRHVHTFLQGSPEAERHLAFRDFLRCNEAKAQAYSDLKARLTKGGESLSWDDYLDGKDPFIKATEREAVEWYRRNRL